MSKKEFSLPKEINQGYELALKNSESLFEIAELAGKLTHYGVGTSLLILSAEEAIKAGILLMKYNDPGMLIQDIGDYFSKHPVKHKMIADIEILYSLMDLMINARIEPLTELVNKQTKPTQREVKKARVKGVKNLISVLEELSSGSRKLYSNQEWWDRANNQKNQGLYVNVVGQKWEAPTSITEKEFQEAREIITGFKEKVMYLKKAFNDSDFPGFYSELKTAWERSMEHKGD